MWFNNFLLTLITALIAMLCWGMNQFHGQLMKRFQQIDDHAIAISILKVQTESIREGQAAMLSELRAIRNNTKP